MACLVLGPQCHPSFPHRLNAAGGSCFTLLHSLDSPFDYVCLVTDDLVAFRVEARNVRLMLFRLIAASLLWPCAVFAGVTWPTLTSSSVATLASPVAIRHAGDGSGRLYFVEKGGRVLASTGGTISTLLTIPSFDLSADGEQGLLGLAFPPSYSAKRYFYVSYTARNGDLVLARVPLVVDMSAVADWGARTTLLVIPHRFAGNHNGGDIHFGPDGYLYWGTGDGGGAGDPQNNAQNPLNLLGKMLRLDTETSSTLTIPPTNPWSAAGDSINDFIFHTGLRNPWRWSFDRLTGEMYIGDVGQNDYEEVNVLPAAASGRNCGWRRREGFHDFNLSEGYGPGQLTEPVTEQGHSTGDASVTGGYVYRGLLYPRMQGIYIFADFSSGRCYGLQRDELGVWQKAILSSSFGGASSFGEDEDGELYWANLNNGRISKLADSNSDASYLAITSSAITPSGQTTLTWGVATGETYQCERSTDLSVWTPDGPLRTATASDSLRLTHTTSLPAGTRGFVRARRE